MKKLSMKEIVTILSIQKRWRWTWFFKILYSSHALICNVKKNSKTEVISLMFLKQPLKDFAIMPRSIHYFLEKTAG